MADHLRVLLLGRGEGGIHAFKSILKAGIPVQEIWTRKHNKQVGSSVADFRRLANDHSLPFRNVTDLSGGDDLARLRELKPDIVICLFWGSIVGQDSIDCARFGFVNLHGGNLPRFRGNACANWALLHDEESMGVTLHFMEGGQIDSGPIIAQTLVPISPTTTVTELYRATLRVGSRMLVNLLLDMESGVEPSATPQDDSQSLRCYPRLPHDGILDWTQSADSLDRHVRSLGPPYSYAYTYWGAEKIEVLKARPIHHRSEYLAVPGHVIAIQPNSSIEVATGDGTLSLDLIATSDRPTPFPPGELIRSIRSRLGLRIEDLLLRIRTLEAVISELGATAKADSEDLLNQRD